MKLLFTVLVVVCLVGCSENEKTTIIVDMGRTFARINDDSVWWQRPIFITDTTYHSETMGDVSSGHSLPQDTLIGLINLKPLVIIAGNDTSRYYWNGTIRFDICKPDTLAKVVTGLGTPSSMKLEHSLYRN